MNLEYSTPNIKDESGKPFSFPNQPFPYSSLPSDRRFEELIYSIYKQEMALMMTHWNCSPISM
jgi:hypothetical protein